MTPARLLTRVAATTPGLVLAAVVWWNWAVRVAQGRGNTTAHLADVASEPSAERQATHTFTDDCGLCYGVCATWQVAS